MQLLIRYKAETKKEFYSKFHIIFLQGNELQTLQNNKNEIKLICRDRNENSGYPLVRRGTDWEKA